LQSIRQILEVELEKFRKELTEKKPIQPGERVDIQELARVTSQETIKALSKTVAVMVNRAIERNLIKIMNGITEGMVQYAKEMAIEQIQSSLHVLPLEEAAKQDEIRAKKETKAEAPSKIEYEIRDGVVQIKSPLPFVPEEETKEKIEETEEETKQRLKKELEKLKEDLQEEQKTIAAAAEMVEVPKEKGVTSKGTPRKKVKRTGEPIITTVHGFTIPRRKNGTINWKHETISPEEITYHIVKHAEAVGIDIHAISKFEKSGSEYKGVSHQIRVHSIYKKWSDFLEDYKSGRFFSIEEKELEDQVEV
jgi:hypothetical protein